MAVEKSLGVATNKARIELGTISGATIDDCVIGGTTAAAGTFAAITGTNLTTTGNTALGNAITDTIGFYGTTPIAQRAGAAQATSLVGTASSADVTSDLKAAVIEIQNTLIALGLFKGAA